MNKRNATMLAGTMFLKKLLLITIVFLGAVHAAHADESDVYVQSLATDYGLTMRQLDEKGAVLDKDAGPIGKRIISYKGKDILEKHEMYVDFVGPLYKLGDESLVLVALSSGGNACGATYVLISLKDGAAKTTPEFGNCAEPEITATPTAVEFRFYDGYGKRIVETYSNGAVTEAKTTLPLNADPNNNGKDFNYLAPYTDRDNVEKILTDSTVSPMLAQLMGPDADKLKERLEVMDSPELRDDYLVMQGGMAHGFTEEEAVLALSLTSHNIYAAILTNDNGQQTIRAYTNAPRGAEGVQAPPAMKAWLERYPDARLNWVFAS